MIGNKKRILFIILHFLIANPTNAQFNYSFVKHLSTHNLQKEHFTYLQELPETEQDSRNYLFAKYYLQYFNDSLFISFYLGSKEMFMRDSNAFIMANIRFLKENNSFQKLWFDSYKDRNVSEENKIIQDAYMASINPLDFDAGLLPDKLQFGFNKYKKSEKKKPVVAAMLSGLIPGLGKLYAGRKRSFYTVLFFHLIYGAQNYELINRLGIQNPFSIVSLSFLGVFYVANIYGSYQDVKEVNKESKTQFLNDASEYYNFHYSRDLY
ncbi:MAG: hypothetical protein A3H98_12540 [Bacteroidetes bacterium RIFCSPLOWO2_02_FULL_36_8]|nr:MAG: hypothetical protein A3H98_12540 [Bacteroidetes bacterium RIFCSPLOWO2_02_FULL_36_8]OFY69925.1 MAG: hypothetical protein A3G23_05560 [Bacteroidetes bacterium RIFCSPLOWO2_12_FULL_37_12]